MPAALHNFFTYKNDNWLLFMGAYNNNCQEGTEQRRGKMIIGYGVGGIPLRWFRVNGPAPAPNGTLAKKYSRHCFFARRWIFSPPACSLAPCRWVNSITKIFSIFWKNYAGPHLHNSFINKNDNWHSLSHAYNNNCQEGIKWKSNGNRIDIDKTEKNILNWKEVKMHPP